MQSLTKLNLALAIGHFELLEKIFGVVGPTLRELTIRYREHLSCPLILRDLIIFSYS